MKRPLTHCLPALGGALLLACNGGVAVAPGTGGGGASSSSSSASSSSSSASSSSSSSASSSSSSSSGAVVKSLPWSKSVVSLAASWAVRPDDSVVYVACVLAPGGSTCAGSSVVDVDAAGGVVRTIDVTGQGAQVVAEPAGAVIVVASVAAGPGYVGATGYTAAEAGVVTARVEAGTKDAAWLLPRTGADLGLAAPWWFGAGWGSGPASDGSFAVTSAAADVAVPPPLRRLQISTFSAAGAPGWSRPILCDAGLEGGVTTVLPSGDVVISGLMHGAIDLGAGPEPILATGPDARDGFVARYGPGGALGFHRHLAASSETVVDAVEQATDDAGDLLISIEAYGPVDLGGGPVGKPGVYSAVVGKLGPAGEHLWSRAILATPHLAHVAPAADGATWACVTAEKGLVVEGQPLTVDGPTDVLVLRYDAAGNLVATRQYGGGGTDLCDGIKTGASGAVVIGGRCEGGVNFGQGPITAATGLNGFLAKLGPGP